MKQWIKELTLINRDIQNLKTSAIESDDASTMRTENEILKTKIGDLETQMNTRSAGDSQLLAIYEKKMK